MNVQPGVCWPVTRYVILLFVFNTVCYVYLIFQIFVNFVGYLSMKIYVVLYLIKNTQGVKK